MAVKAYIKNPKFGTGDEPEFIQVPFKGSNEQISTLKVQINDLYSKKVDNTELDKYETTENLLNRNYITSSYVDSKLGEFVSSEDLTAATSGLLGKEDAKLLYQVRGDYVSRSDLGDILSKEDADKLYQPIGDYATSSDISDINSSIDSINSNISDLSNNVESLNESKSDKTTIVTNAGTGEVTASIDPNKFYQFGEVTSLNITLNAPTDPLVLNIYAFQFVSGSSVPTLSIVGTSEIKWIGGEMPEIESGLTYQVTILNNLAAMGGA